MRHNFPAIEALEAAELDVPSVREVAPGVDFERLLVREASPWVEKLILRRYAAIAFPHVIYMHSRWYRRPRVAVARLVVHELVHVSQWHHVGKLRFAALYVGDYLRGRLARRGHEVAYREIRYETQARDATDRVFAR